MTCVNVSIPLRTASENGFFICLVAAAAVPSAAPKASSAPVDPIYAAIKTHRGRVKAHDTVWQVRAGFKDFGKMTEDEKAQLQQFNDATDAAHLPLEAAALDHHANDASRHHRCDFLHANPASQ